MISSVPRRSNSMLASVEVASGVHVSERHEAGVAFGSSTQDANDSHEVWGDICCNPENEQA
jgi:hypothetical protein